MSLSIISVGLDILWATLFMWLPQFKLIFIVIPKKLKLFTYSNKEPLINIIGFSAFFYDMKYNICHWNQYLVK